ncbi:MAG: tetratricopeptide repeat protein [Tannerella sp.]|jgi:tetratricopeptide (TPR) repeat protein|nr:tetratricopeptide repeat protein [Tannerella sp.]
MRKVFVFLFTALQVVAVATAQKKPPKWTGKVSKAIITVETTTKEGISKTGNGFFIRENGEAAAAYDLFINAEKAVVTTSTGEKLPVTHILGADDMYGVIRFRVAASGKTAFLTQAKTVIPSGSTVYIPPSKEVKDVTQGAISEITKVNGAYDYYKIETPLPKSQEGYPLLNGDGEVFALTQADASGKGKTYGISVAYIKSLQIASMDLFKRTYSDIGIRKAWPQSAEDAQITLLFYASREDAPAYLETLNDFISAFPAHAESYMNRAAHYAYHRKELASTGNEQLNMLDLAWTDMEKAEKQTKNRGESYFNKAKLIFGIATGDSTLRYKDWNVKTATAYLQKAISVEDLPIYRQLEGDIAFYNGDYEKAFDAYSIVNRSPVASGLSYYLAAKSKQQAGGAGNMEVIALIDSAVARSPNAEAREYVLESVDLKIQAGLYELAVKDYDKYYMLTGGDVGDGFYYYREQAKFRTNDLDGALKDIEKAISLNRENAIYHAEMASIYLRLKDPDKAQECVEKAIALEPEFASAYRILGICLIRRDKKDDACKNLEKAKELGDPVVDRLIREHCN